MIRSQGAADIQHSTVLYSVSQKKSPCGFLTFFPKRLGIFNQFFIRSFYARLQIFIQLSPTLTKLCHPKRDHPSIFFYISLELNF